MNIKRPLISVLIPNWNGAQDTIECLDTLVAQDYGPENIEIFVVDNGSEDDSVFQIQSKLDQIGYAFRHWDLIVHKENKGIAIAYNRALEYCSVGTSALLRLDNDVLLTEHAVSRLMAKMNSRHDVAVVGCRITSYDMSPKLAHHHGALKINWWSGKANNSFPDSDVDCDGVAGCAMLIRATAVRQLAWFFDPNRFLANELDLCQRLQIAGWTVKYTPSVEIFHKGAKSSAKRHSLVRFEVLRDGYIFHLTYNRYPALAWYLLNSFIRATARWLLGDPMRLKAFKEAWVQVHQLHDTPNFSESSD